MNRARLSDGDFDEKHLGDSNKDKSLKARISKSNTTSKEGDKSTRIQEGEKKDKDKKRKGGDIVSNELKISNICWYYQKLGYLKSNYPDKNKSAIIVAAVSIKNESTSLASSKRSRKNE